MISDLEVGDRVSSGGRGFQWIKSSVRCGTRFTDLHHNSRRNLLVSPVKKKELCALVARELGQSFRPLHSH